jgi:hypothetical protein
VSADVPQTQPEHATDAEHENLRLSLHSVVTCGALLLSGILPIVALPVSVFCALAAPRRSLLRTISLSAAVLATVFLVAHNVPDLAFLIVP